MTSLDRILSILTSKCDLISAIQITPKNVQLVVIKNEFWKCLRALKNNDIRFRFLEKRKAGLDIHFSFFILENLCDVTFRVIDYSSDFIQELKENYPPAALFVENLNANYL